MSLKCTLQYMCYSRVVDKLSMVFTPVTQSQISNAGKEILLTTLKLTVVRQVYVIHVLSFSFMALFIF